MSEIEVNMVVSDSREALILYEKIFDKIERIEVTAFAKGNNEAIFTLHNMRIHMLDENKDCGLFAPQPETPQSMWINVIVPDIKNTYQKAMEAGCAAIQPPTEIPSHGMINAIFKDRFGYPWMLHEAARKK